MHSFEKENPAAIYFWDFNRAFFYPISHLNVTLVLQDRLDPGQYGTRS